MALAPGTRIGVYEIVSLLGAGGMGEVYRATDTRLKRDVALKVLLPEIAQNPERLARFEREAQILASLNHPNIAAIYGVEQAGETTALVLEFIDGPTLADRIAATNGRGLPIEEAWPIARQIAEALETAHERGIIHRDLKPANIKVRSDGTVKVLDFGLAKAMEPAAGSSPSLSLSPTTTSPAMMTGVGVILGTAAYMSPEQARGKAVDKRSDIWAFGVVVWEMVTGAPLFTKSTTSDTLAAVLQAVPDSSRLPSDTPDQIRRLLRRCLEKDRHRRLADIADARLEIDDVDSDASVPMQNVAPKAPAGLRQHRLALASLLVGAAIAAVIDRAGDRPTVDVSRGASRSVIPFAAGSRLTLGVSEAAPIGGVAISPDGRNVVYSAESSVGVTQLYLRPMDRLEATAIPGTQDGSGPFFSPDGQWLGFFANDKIVKVALSGGAPVILCDAPSFRGASWAPDGRIVFATQFELLEVSAGGGGSRVVATPDREGREKTFRLPDVLPGRAGVIMTVGTADIASFDDARIEVLSLPTRQRRVLVEGGTSARYVGNGQMIYAHAGAILIVPFDVDRLEVTGPPKTLVSGVLSDPASGYAHFTSSRNGVLVYAAGPADPLERSMVWVDRSGRTQAVSDIKRRFEEVKLSPSGRHVAVKLGGATDEVWIYDLTSNTLQRLAFGWDNFRPIWTPDGTRVVFGSGRSGVKNSLFWQRADGSGPAELLASGIYPEAWSSDATSLLFSTRADVGSWDVFTLPIQDRTARPVLQTPANEFGAVLSPNGRWIAYVSDHSGRNEIYAQPFPTAGPRTLLSTTGGDSPSWASDGRELFYREGNKVMAVRVTPGSTLMNERPRRLFEGAYLRSYDVARDGRFLMLRDGEHDPIRELVVVQGWLEGLNAAPAASR